MLRRPYLQSGITASQLDVAAGITGSQLAASAGLLASQMSSSGQPQHAMLGANGSGGVVWDTNALLIPDLVNSFVIGANTALNLTGLSAASTSATLNAGSAYINTGTSIGRYSLQSNTTFTLPVATGSNLADIYIDFNGSTITATKGTEYTGTAFTVPPAVATNSIRLWRVQVNSSGYIAGSVADWRVFNPLFITPPQILGGGSDLGPGYGFETIPRAVISVTSGLTSGTAYSMSFRPSSTQTIPGNITILAAPTTAVWTHFELALYVDIGGYNLVRLATTGDLPTGTPSGTSGTYTFSLSGSLTLNAGWRYVVFFSQQLTSGTCNYGFKAPGTVAPVTGTVNASQLGQYTTAKSVLSSTIGSPMAATVTAGSTGPTSNWLWAYLN